MKCNGSYMLITRVIVKALNYECKNKTLKTECLKLCLIDRKRFEHRPLARMYKNALEGGCRCTGYGHTT